MSADTYFAYGMQISSDIKLPLHRVDSREHTAGHNASADVVIRIGEVPSALVSPATITPAFQVTSREFLFCLPGVGRFVVQDGRNVCVQPEGAAPEEMLGLHLAHSGLAAVLHQRGKRPLHASAALVDGGCVAFLGRSMAGKSTIAAALNQRGYQVVCDDICPVSFSGGIASASPGTGRFELWADSARALGLDTFKAARAQPEGERYCFASEFTAFEPPIPLRRLYILHQSRRKAPGIRRQTGIEAFQCLFGYTYFAPHIAGFDNETNVFLATAGIARTVPIFEWCYVPGLDRLNDTVDTLMQHLESHFLSG